MKLQKGIVKYKDRTDIVVNYCVTDNGETYYFLDAKDESRLKNGNRIVTTLLVEAIDPMVKASNIGVIDESGKIVIPCNNKSIRIVNDDAILVEVSTPVTQSVIEANSLRSDPLAATKLVSTPALIKDKINTQIKNTAGGVAGRYLFNDQFSEATICDNDGKNLVNDEYYSFIALANDKLYFSKNTPDSDVVEQALFPADIQSNLAEDAQNIDVTQLAVSPDVVDNAMSADNNVAAVSSTAVEVSSEQALENVSAVGTVASDVVIPKVEADAPVEGTPAVAEPVAEAPVEEVPAVAEPVAEAPVEEAPAVAEPVAEAPVEEAPAVAESVAEAPVEEAPAVAEPVAEAPVEEVPAVAEPVAEAPVEEAPAVAEPVAEAPVEEAPAVAEPVAETPVEDDVELKIDFDDDNVSNDIINDSENENSSIDDMVNQIDAVEEANVFNESFKADTIDVTEDYGESFDDKISMSGDGSIMLDVANSMAGLMNQNKELKAAIEEEKRNVKRIESSRDIAISKANALKQKCDILNSKFQNAEETILNLERTIEELRNKVREQGMIIEEQENGKEKLVKLAAAANALLNEDKSYDDSSYYKRVA